MINCIILLSCVLEIQHRWKQISTNMIVANILIKKYKDVSKKTMSVIWAWSVLETSHLGSSAENSHSQNPVSIINTVSVHFPKQRETKKMWSFSITVRVFPCSSFHFSTALSKDRGKENKLYSLIISEKSPEPVDIICHGVNGSHGRCTIRAWAFRRK